MLIWRLTSHKHGVTFATTSATAYPVSIETVTRVFICPSAASDTLWTTHARS